MTDDHTAEDTTDSSPSEETPETLAQLQRERDECQDLLLRKTAELDNYRKRTERERAAVEQAAARDLISEILLLVDDLERALSVDAESATANSYRDGIELIHKQLLLLLEKRGVTPIDSLGSEFDPEFHQAVAMVTTEDFRDGEVVEELRRGYILRNRLLRPSMVKVAKS